MVQLKSGIEYDSVKITSGSERSPGPERVLKCLCEESALRILSSHTYRK